MYLFGCLFAILFLGVFLIISLIKGFFGLFFRSGRKKEKASAFEETAEADTTFDNTPRPTNRKKIIDKDEGEYVDFEEL